jgi:hypothetical protein
VKVKSALVLIGQRAETRDFCLACIIQQFSM